MKFGLHCAHVIGDVAVVPWVVVVVVDAFVVGVVVTVVTFTVVAGCSVLL